MTTDTTATMTMMKRTPPTAIPSTVVPVNAALFVSVLSKGVG